MTAPSLSVGFDRARTLTARLIAVSSTSAAAPTQYRRAHHRWAQPARPGPASPPAVRASGPPSSACPVGACAADVRSTNVGRVMALKLVPTAPLCESRTRISARSTRAGTYPGPGSSPGLCAGPLRRSPRWLAEAGTRLADRPDAVSDDVWDMAAKHFDEPPLSALVLNIALINTMNRLNVITGHVAGEWTAEYVG